MRNLAEISSGISAEKSWKSRSEVEVYDKMFRGAGWVTEAVVHTQDGSSKARATVTFVDSSQAERAVSTMHGKLIEGIGNIGVKMLTPDKEGVRKSKKRKVV